jgi:hypothetical protein
VTKKQQRINQKKMKILSIDAWADGYRGWSWNNWFHVGDIETEQFETLKTNRKVLAWFRANGFLTDASKGNVSVEDDGYNLVVVDRQNRMPLFAIEYGT